MAGKSPQAIGLVPGQGSDGGNFDVFLFPGIKSCAKCSRPGANLLNLTPPLTRRRRSGTIHSYYLIYLL